MTKQTIVTKKRVPYTVEEITLCTYAAMYDKNDFGGYASIHRLAQNPEKKHSTASIKMKIKNIASMLDERNIHREKNGVTPLTGLPTGEKGRTTNWNVVQTLYGLEKKDFQKKCMQIIAKAKNRLE